MPDEEFDAFRSRILTPDPYMIFRNEFRKFTTPKAFERLVADLFRQMGGDVELGKGRTDEATDILIKTADGNYIVQCKKTKAPVGVNVVREVYGAARKQGAKGAIIVTISEFTSGAKEFLVDLRPPSVGLIDGWELFNLMNQHMPIVVADILKKAEAAGRNKWCNLV